MKIAINSAQQRADRTKMISIEAASDSRSFRGTASGRVPFALCQALISLPNTPAGTPILGHQLGFPSHTILCQFWDSIFRKFIFDIGRVCAYSGISPSTLE